MGPSCPRLMESRTQDITDLICNKSYDPNKKLIAESDISSNNTWLTTRRTPKEAAAGVSICPASGDALQTPLSTAARHPAAAGNSPCHGQRWHSHSHVPTSSTFSEE
jgi:hypothetical protein